MKRMTMLIVLVLLPSLADAQSVGIRLGLPGGWVADGEWVPCELTGLDEVGEGTVTVKVGEGLSFQLRVRDGRAKGHILLPTREELITVEGVTANAIVMPGDALGSLKHVGSRIPLAVLDEAKSSHGFVEQRLIPMRAVAAIPLDSDQLAGIAPRDLRWVQAVALGGKSSSALTDRFGWLSRSVVVCPDNEVPEALSTLPFESFGKMKVLNAGLAPELQAPRGVERPKVCRIFGAPEWSDARRLSVALLLGGYFLLTALASVFLLDSPGKRRLLTVLLVAGGTAVLWAAGRGQPVSEERVSILSYCDGSSFGIQTEFLSVGALEDMTLERRIDPDNPWVPVTIKLDYWVQDPIHVDADGMLTRRLGKDHWQVFTRRATVPVGERVPLEGEFEIEGSIVRPDAGGGQTVQFMVYLEAAFTGASREALLRRNVLTYWWREERFEHCRYRLGWERREGESARLVARMLPDSPEMTD